MSDDYSQPDYYRFNSDSITLVNYLLKSMGPTESILDLGAGCGIIGIELARYLSPQKLRITKRIFGAYD
jgi:tRNA1(Val) A37 N6-methylase TrmN6